MMANLYKYDLHNAKKKGWNEIEKDINIIPFWVAKLTAKFFLSSFYKRSTFFFNISRNIKM